MILTDLEEVNVVVICGHSCSIRLGIVRPGKALWEMEVVAEFDWDQDGPLNAETLGTGYHQVSLRKDTP